jgi:hypothetical protein
MFEFDRGIVAADFHYKAWNSIPNSGSDILYESNLQILYISLIYHLSFTSLL